MLYGVGCKTYIRHNIVGMIYFHPLFMNRKFHYEKKRRHHHSHIIYLLRKFIWRPMHKDNIHLATRGILITRKNIYIIIRVERKKGPSRLLLNVFLSFGNLQCIRPVKDGQVPNAAATGRETLDASIYNIQ